MTCVFIIIVLIIVILDTFTPTKLITGEIVEITCSIGIVIILATIATGKNDNIFKLPLNKILSVLVVVIIKKSLNHKGKLIQRKRNSTEPHCDTCKRSDSIDSEMSGYKEMDNKEVLHSSSLWLSIVLSYNTQEKSTINNETSTADQDDSHKVTFKIIILIVFIIFFLVSNTNSTLC